MISVFFSGEGTFFVGGNDHFVACRDGNVDVADSVPGTDLRAFGIESDSKRTTFLFPLRGTSVVNHTLMILYS
jgi:hypothetical protein